MKILMYGEGISNESVKKVLNRLDIKYDTSDKKTKYDYIVKSPGIRKEEVKACGLVVSDIEFLYTLFNPFIIGVTGTNGKTTTVLLIEHILKDILYIETGGNIGIPFGDIIFSSSIKLLELSSFQLDTVYTLKPKIAVLLNINEAHLDYHKTFDNYYNAKKKLINNMDHNSIIIYNYDDKNICKMVQDSNTYKLSFSIKSNKSDIYYEKGIIKYKDLNVSVKDTYSDNIVDIKNMMAGILVSKIFNVKDSIIIEKLSTFKKPKYRMEYIKDNIINDAKSTNITSTLASINKLFNVHLICGGYDRHDNLESLKLLFPHVKKFYLYGQNKERYKTFLSENKKDYSCYESLKDIIPDIKSIKDIILYSPMAPSYDQYESYIKRGEEFEELIKKAL